MDREKLRDIFRKYRAVGLVLLAGLLLLLLPTGKSSGQERQTSDDTQLYSLEETERRMAQLLGRMSGVGRVQVMLSLKTGPTLQLAQDMGMDRNHIAIADNGSVIEITAKTIKLGGTVPSGEVYVDGSGVGDVGAVVMRDRKRLAEDGMVVVVLPISAHDGNLLSEPEIITRGFIYVKESGDLMKELQSVARDAAENVSRKRGRDDGELKGSVKSAVSSYLFKTTKRNPMVIPVVTRL